MIVVHIESGLGNQMLSYSEYLALRSANPHQEFFIETIIYEIPECGEYICQWNGYELDRIFGIDTPKNIKTLFREEEWEQIVAEVKQTEFWKHNWNYPVAITSVLNKHGLNLKNVRGDFSVGANVKYRKNDHKRSFSEIIRESRFSNFVKRFLYRTFENKFAYRLNDKDQLFSKYEGDIFTGQWLRINYRGNGLSLVEAQMRKTFIFPPFEDSRNKEMSEYLRSVNSVAIHARRGDMTGLLAEYYKFGYFKRAVKIIRKRVKNPVFVFFTNQGDMDWCKANAKVFGLDFKKDVVKFVNWNAGLESYRDMQLMGFCKHAIITPSSFGWWGSWFIDNPDKITVSPRIEMETGYHC